MTTVRHVFVGRDRRLGGCDATTENPERGVGGNVLCSHCDAYFPAAQFEFFESGEVAGSVSFEVTPNPETK